MNIISPDEAVRLLRNGNDRYAAMHRLSDPGVGPEVRRPLLEGQWPYATILSCSDSRVPPEVIFDEGLGRLFTVRVAGICLNPDLLGSIEYATLYSTSRLILVMGHESCGAVGAAVNAFENPDVKETPGIQSLIEHLLPAVKLAKEQTGLSGFALVDTVSKINARLMIQDILEQSAPLRELHAKGEVKIIGGFYSLHTGKVDIWA